MGRGVLRSIYVSKVCMWTINTSYHRCDMRQAVCVCSIKLKIHLAPLHQQFQFLNGSELWTLQSRAKFSLCTCKVSRCLRDIGSINSFYVAPLAATNLKALLQLLYLVRRTSKYYIPGIFMFYPYLILRSTVLRNMYLVGYTTYSYLLHMLSQHILRSSQECRILLVLIVKANNAKFSCQLLLLF